MLPIRPWRSELRRKQHDKERRSLYETADYQGFLRSNRVVQKLATTENAVIRQRRHMPLARSESPDKAPGHGHGVKTVRDRPEAHVLIKEFDLLPPNPVEDWGHDFIRLNKRSQGRATTPRTVHTYRKANDIRLRPRSAVELERRRQRARSQPIPARPSSAQRRAMEVVHGEPMFRDVTVADLIRNGFQFDWVKEQAWRQEQKLRKEQREQQRLEEGLQRIKLMRSQGLVPNASHALVAAPPPDAPQEEFNGVRPISADKQISQFARKFREQVALQKTYAPEATPHLPALTADSIHHRAAVAPA